MRREINFSLRFKEKMHPRHVQNERFWLPQKPLILMHIPSRRWTSTALILMPFSDKFNLVMLIINASRDQLFITIQRKDEPAS
jgi:hypothetical protein